MKPTEEKMDRMDDRETASPAAPDPDPLEFRRVLDRVARTAETEMGQDRVRALTVGRTIEELKRVQAGLREASGLLAGEGVSMRGAAPVADLAQRAAKGAVLTPEELVSCARTLTVAAAVFRLLARRQCQVLAEGLTTPVVPEGLAARIGAALTDDAAVRDDASPELYRIRGTIRRLEQELADVLEGIVRSPEWAPYLQEAVITTRLGRRVVPVKATFKNQVRGLIHDQSASGQTVFIEPMAVVERQNRITEWRRREKTEIERILAELSEAVGAEAPALSGIHRDIGWLDCQLAVARYGLATRGMLPEIGTDDLVLKDARHPLLTRPVPVTVRLTGPHRILVVTGPNTGGKTVVLKTVGLMVTMALAGMMVPCADGTRIPAVDRVWVDIGDEQSLDQNLSTFSSHMTRLIPMIEDAHPDTLCLIDEIGAGTDPDEGAALAEAMIERLRSSGTRAVITTHHSRLKLLAFRYRDVENAQVEFDRETLTPTYRLVMGQPGGSEALFIAEKLGMPPDVVQLARRLIGPAGGRLSDAIDEVNRIAQDLRRQEDQLRQRQESLAEEARRLAAERAAWHAEEERQKARARDQWRRQWEVLTERFNRALAEAREHEGKERARAMAMLRETYKEASVVPEAIRADRPAAEGPAESGDWVRIDGFPDAGRVLTVQGRMATVELGSLRIKLPVGDLVKVTQPPASPKTPPGSRRTATKSPPALELDLRGLSVDDALRAVDKYLDDAVLSGMPFGRLIHGKGTGVLRRAVGDALKGDARVADFRLGGPGEGGDGVTVVMFDQGE